MDWGLLSYYPIDGFPLFVVINRIDRASARLGQSSRTGFGENMSGRRKRKQERQTPKRPLDLQLETASSNGRAAAIPATLIDFSEYGCGLQTTTPLNVGEIVTVKNLGFPDRKNGVAARKARISYCRLHDEGVYRSGLAFEEEPGRSTNTPTAQTKRSQTAPYQTTTKSSKSAHRRISKLFSASTGCLRSDSIPTTPRRAMTRDSALCCKPITLSATQRTAPPTM